MNNFRKLTATLLVICLFCSISACSLNGESDKTTDMGPHKIQKYTLPDTDSRGSFEPTLYSYSKSSVSLIKTVQQIYLYDANTTPLKALLSALFAKNDVFRSITFKDVSLSNDICSVFFSGDLPSDIDTWFGLEAMISATLQEFCGVSKILLFLNDSPVYYNGIPIGIVSYGGQPLYEYIAERKEAVNLDNDNETAFTIPSIQYVPVFSTPHELVCAKQVNRKISTQDSMEKSVNDVVAMLIDDISEEYSREYDVVIGKVCDYKFVSARKKAGKYSVKIHLNDFAKDTMEYQIKHSVVLTLVSSIPNIGEVCIKTNDSEFENMNFDDCRGHIGTMISAFYPTADSMTLESKKIYISSDESYSTDSIFVRMQEHYAIEDTLFPYDLIDSDFGVTETAGIAVINFDNDSQKRAMDFINDTSNFDSPETGERLFIYSIVNTLTQLPHINRVLFVVNGKIIEQPFSRIYLGKPLVPNPGLLQSNGQ